MAGASGAVALGVVAGLLGGTRGLVSAPCGPAAALLAALVIEWIGPGGVAPDEVPALLVVVVLLAGLLQVLFGILGGGRLIKFIPYPVVAGYLSAAGVLDWDGWQSCPTNAVWRRAHGLGVTGGRAGALLRHIYLTSSIGVMKPAWLIRNAARL
jgi:hypothetical protein